MKIRDVIKLIEEDVVSGCDEMYRFLIVMKRLYGTYSAYSPDLPGCVATGKSRDDATRNMYEAIEMHVRGLIEDALPVRRVPLFVSTVAVPSIAP